MIILIYFAAASIYAGTVTLSYSDRIKATNWYFPAGITLAILANVLWLYVAKVSPDKNTIFIRGLVWDSIIVSCYTLMPIAFGVRFSMFSGLGLAMIIVGICLTKIQ